MASSASDLLKLELQADGENSGTWGQKANVLFERLEESIAEQLSISLASLGGANYTLDDTQYVKNSGTTGESHVATLKLTGTMTGNEGVIVPGRNKQYLIWNATSGAYTATVKTSGGSGVAVPQGYIQQVFCDGTNVEAMGPPVDADGLIYFAKGGDIASASPLVIDTDGYMFDVTGTTGFSAMTVAAGRWFILQFDGALTMTHGAGTLDLLGAANITTAAGDIGLFYSTAANVVRMVSWTPASYAVASDLNTGTNTNKPVTSDALAGSNYGTAVVPLIVFNDSTDCATGDGAGDIWFRVPSVLNGFDLVGVAACCQTAGTTGTMDVQVHNVTQAADMLTTKITIDSAETDSSTAATPAVIDTANDDVATGDQIRIDVDAVHTTPAKGLLVELQFRLP